ncbi:DUF3289 family protein, partial [Salmonella enterica]|nr:DUF3289 family protein [Salmonella enterica]
IDDMQYGDMDDGDFQQLGLVDISMRVDPFKCLQFETMYSFNTHALDFAPQKLQGRPISRQQCADIMFDEMKELSSQFASGQYAPLIGKLIDHFHYGNGQPWTDELLNRAYAEIISGIGTNDVLVKIKRAINERLNSKKQVIIDYGFIMEIKSVIKRDSRLPKFNRFIDKFNGLGISVHDIYAQRISLARLQRYAMSWEGLLFFKGPDHFGLGKEDITDALYNKFRFFRIWFFLQRHRDYAYKPFMTNFSAHIRINGRV